MFVLEVDTNKFKKDIEKIFREVKEKTEKESLKVAKNIIHETIATKGFGAWKGNKMNDNIPLSFLHLFVKIEKNKVGFLPGKKVGNKFLNRYVINHQEGYRVPTSEKMRRFLASKKYFIRRATKVLEIPARPIVPIAQKQIESRMPEIYGKIFERVMNEH